MRQNDGQGRSGFTLIEVVLTIGLIGILGFSVAIITGGVTSGNLAVAAKKVQSDIQFARSLAMTNQGTTYGVAFTDSSDSYIVYETDVGSPVTNPLTKEAMNEDFSQFPGISITGGNFTVEFNRYGAPTTGGGGNVQLTDGSSTKSIEVTTNTGRVVVP